MPDLYADVYGATYGASPPGLQFVQDVCSASGTLITNVMTLGGGINTTQGHLLVVSASGTVGAHLASVADSRGNTWQVDAAGGAVNSNSGIASCLVAAGKVLIAGDTITVTFSAAEPSRCCCEEYSGVAQTAGGLPATDKVKNTHSASTGAITCATTANSQAGNLTVATCGTPNTSATFTITTPDGDSGQAWVNRNYPGTGGVVQMYQAGPNTASLYSAVITPSAGANSDACVVTYKAAPVITTTSLAGGTQGTAYSQTVAGQWGVGAYTWTITSGSLPAGLTIASSTGVISGTPTGAGTSSFTVTLTDTGTNTHAAPLSIVVTGSLAVSTTSLPGGTQGVAYSQVLTATGGTPGYTWTVSSGSLPPGLNLTGATIAGTPSSTGTASFTVQVTDSLGHTATQALSIAVAAAASMVFPGSPLGILIEILLNGTWTDITAYGYQRDGIVITGGSSQEGDTPQPAQMTLTLNNRDGRFSPNNVSGAYYPDLQRNIQIRVSVTATSLTGVSYAGYRFWGTVAEWPPLSDLSGNDVYVQITASGPLRQVNQGGGKGGALTRYYDSLEGTSFAPVAYWPCEEDTSTTFICSGVIGGTNMTITGTPLWKGSNSFNGSAPMPIVNRSIWDGFTGQFGSTGNDVFAAPGTYTWVASTATVDARCWGGGGGATKGSIGNGGGAAGGGGEFAEETTLGVTPGTPYQVTVGAGGAQGDWDAGGTNGTASVFAGDTTTVTAHGGQGAGNNGSPGGTGGTGSSNSTHHNGGAGGNDVAGLNGGAGGGGSAGTGANGNTGSNSVSGADAPGGAARTGGAAGGYGGYQVNGQPGRAPGGGGGGGWANQSDKTYGGSGGSGQVELIYTPAPTTQPPANVIRFLMASPTWGGVNGSVLVRTFTAGTLTHLDVCYVTGGKLQLKGYTGAGLGSLAFTSSNITVGDGQPVMVSVELANNNTGGVAWALRAVIPGGTGFKGTTTGTQATATIGNVTEVTVSPNADVTKTAIGHISVQYALIPLLQVSDAVNGHLGEMGIDRFIRLCAEQALGNLVEFSEGADHWGFASSTQGWAGTNCALTVSGVTVGTPSPGAIGGAYWPTEGVTSLLLTANGAGQPSANSPTGFHGQPVNAGDLVSVAADAYTPAGLPNVYIGVLWYQSSGVPCAHPLDVAGDNTMAAGAILTLKKKATAPSGAAWFAVIVGDHNTDAGGSLLYIDNVRTSPRMGTQTRDDYRNYLKQVKDLEQGLLKEAKELYGLKYKTRIALLNQTPALTLDYAAGQVAAPLLPVQDDKLTVNQVTVKRTEGSRVTVSQASGIMSTGLPPSGVGKYGKQAKVVAEDDAQLIALATHLLNLGTDTTSRYPDITVNLSRSACAPILAAAADAEIGDYIAVINLPFWYPETTAKQLIIGYTETLNAYEWTMDWNCTPENPWEITATSIRRW